MIKNTHSLAVLPETGLQWFSGGVHRTGDSEDHEGLGISPLILAMGESRHPALSAAYFFPSFAMDI